MMILWGIQILAAQSLKDVKVNSEREPNNITIHFSRLHSNVLFAVTRPSKSIHTPGTFPYFITSKPQKFSMFLTGILSQSIE